ncbi:T9SS type A sorting domain-containing protein [Algibacter aquimarinus]
MKKLIQLVFILVSFFAKSQNITSAEYFFNIDPGVGNGTTLTVNSNSGTLSQTFNIPTTSITEGFNSIYIRTYNSDNNWSLYDRQTFYLKSFDTFTITAAEYFFNTDPGVGNGTALSIDTNSGQLAQIFSIPTTSLPEGFHSFYLRTQDNANNWSLYDRQIIYIKDFDFTPDEVNAAEYFIDTDPGIGNGTSIAFGNPSLTNQTLNIDSTGLSEGDHIFYIRVQDSNGDWSIYDSAGFIVDSNLSNNDSLFKLTKLYPNPFSNSLVIDTPNNIPINKIKIYNNLGQTVYESSENTKILNLTNLKSGIHILSLDTPLGNSSFKIVKI